MEAKALDALAAMLLTPENLGIMVAAWFLISVTRRVFPEFYKKPVIVRILPLLPMLFCMGLIWLPGLTPKDTTWGWKLILGVVLGWGVGNLHKILKQTVLGNDIFINNKKPDSSIEKPKEDPKVDDENK